MGPAVPDGREGDGGRTLPDVTINPGGLGRVVTPLVPAVAPVLAVGIDGRGDLTFGFSKELVKLTLGVVSAWKRGLHGEFKVSVLTKALRIK